MDNKMNIIILIISIFSNVFVRVQTIGQPAWFWAMFGHLLWTGMLFGLLYMVKVALNKLTDNEY
jgi:hypothetical protein